MTSFYYPSFEIRSQILEERNGFENKIIENVHFLEESFDPSFDLNIIYYWEIAVRNKIKI